MTEQVEGGLEDPDELEPEQGTLALAAPEDDHTRADWEKALAGVLRKSRRLTDDDPDDAAPARLTLTTLDGIEVAPLGTAEALEDLATAGRPGRTGDWDIRAHHGSPSGAERSTNEEVLVDLGGGVTSLWLRGDPGTDWSVLLHDVLLDLAPVVLDASQDPVGTARSLLSHVEAIGVERLHPATNLGVRAEQLDAEVLEEVARLAGEQGILGFVVDATAVHDVGASDGQELGWSMAAAAAYLRTAEEAGLDVGAAAGLVEFRYAATDEQFPTIAKLRAARRLWTRVLELSGVAPDEQSPMRLHAVTSRPMMSRYDPYVNMLRTTVAAFAAGVGGADAVTVLPFDAPLGRPETLGRRVARNTSALLISESHLARVADPAGGAYAVESLTDDLARAGWAELGLVESEGLEALDARIAEVAATRGRQVATRERPITGLTEFPAADEELPEREPDGAWEGVRPWGAAFETLRDDPPAGRVFLATLGTVAAHTARATFATNLLAAGGIGVDVAGATAETDELVAAYGAQRVVCLAGADAAYAEWGAQAAEALREAGAEHVVVAGKPADFADDSCAMGVDALDFLTRTREALT